MNGAVIDMSFTTTRVGRACQLDYSLEDDHGLAIMGLKGDVEVAGRDVAARGDRSSSPRQTARSFR